MVIVERPAEAPAATYRLRWRDYRTWLQESVSETLMIALSMIVRHEVGDRVLKRVIGSALGQQEDIFVARTVSDSSRETISLPSSHLQIYDG